MAIYEGSSGCAVRHYVCTRKRDTIFVHDTRNGALAEIAAADVDSMCACGDHLFYFSYPGRGSLLDPETGTLLRSWGPAEPRRAEQTHPADVESCVSSASHVAGVTSSTFVYVCSFASSATRVLHHPHAVTDASFHPHKDELVVAYDSSLCVWCTSGWTVLRRVPTDAYFMSLAHSSCGRYLAIGGTGNRVRVWTTELTPLVEFQVHSLVTSLSFSPCATLLMTMDVRTDCTEWVWGESRLVSKQTVDKVAMSWPLARATYRGCGALVCSDNAVCRLPLTFYGHSTNSRHRYAVQLLDKQKWWPPDISRFILSYLILS